MSCGDVEDTESPNSPIYMQNAAGAATWASKKTGDSGDLCLTDSNKLQGYNCATGANSNKS